MNRRNVCKAKTSILKSSNNGTRKSESVRVGRDYRIIRLLYYLLVERMTKVDENIKSAQNLLSWIVERCHELEEENKELREMLKSNGQIITMRESTIYRLEEENYKLEEKNIKLKDENEGLKEAMKDLNNYNKFRIQENKNLKEKLEQIKETYIRFEDSEREYNKWLWELDQLIMNR